MNRRIEVPIWLVWVLAMSVGLNILVMGGSAVVSLFTGSGTLSLVKPTLTPTAIATATATAAPTRTPLPTKIPTATPVPCGRNEVQGVDCTIDVGGLAVTVVSQERSKTYFNNNTGIEKGPRDESYEVIVIRLRLPLGTIPSDLNVWFEDGGTHAPMIVDETGNIYPIGDAWAEEENELGVVLVFAIPKDIKGLTLIIQPGDEVDLSLVPDLTIAEAAQPTAVQSGGPAESAGGQAAEPTEAP